MHIYLDESGDLGFEFGDKNPSSHFVITLLVCDNSESAKAIKKAVEKTIKNKMNAKTRNSHELKGTRSNIGIKTYFFNNAVKNNSWKVYSIILDKKVLLTKLIAPIDKHRIYNVLANHLLKHDVIPEERRCNVEKSIQIALGDIVLQEVIQLACGSLSIILKLISNDNRTYILRVMDLGDNLLNRKNQILCLQKAIEFDLAPRCLYANAENGIIVMEFIPSVPITITPRWLKEIASSLRRLHTDRSFPAPHQPLFEYMRDLENSLIQKGVSPFIINYFEQIRKIRAKLLPHLEYTSSHNDLNFTNLLFDDKKTYFIDWEAAGMEDPFFDIATICNEFVEDEKNIALFLSNYFLNGPSLYQRAKTLLMRQIAYCYSAAHFLDFSASTGVGLTQIERVTNVPTIIEWKHGYYSTKQYHLTTGDDFLFHAMIKLNASISLMETKDFMVAMKQFSCA